MTIVRSIFLESAGIVVPDNLKTDNKLYIHMIGVHDTEATSSHAGDLSQAAAPL